MLLCSIRRFAIVFRAADAIGSRRRNDGCIFFQRRLRDIFADALIPARRLLKKGKKGPTPVLLIQMKIRLIFA